MFLNFDEENFVQLFIGVGVMVHAAIRSGMQFHMAALAAAVYVSLIFEQQELLKRAEVIRQNLTASTWHELETNGKFDKNAKLTFISDDMLILGCDVGSETHYMRAIDTRGRELSKSAFPFSNDSEGFQSAREWAVELAARYDKTQFGTAEAGAISRRSDGIGRIRDKTDLARCQAAGTRL